MSNPAARMLCESYKDHAARLYGMCRALQIDVDQLRASTAAQVAADIAALIGDRATDQLLRSLLQRVREAVDPGVFDPDAASGSFDISPFSLNLGDLDEVDPPR